MIQGILLASSVAFSVAEGLVGVAYANTVLSVRDRSVYMLSLLLISSQSVEVILVMDSISPFPGKPKFVV